MCVIHWYSGIPSGARGTLEATLEAMTFIMLLAFSPLLTDEHTDEQAHICGTEGEVNERKTGCSTKPRQGSEIKDGLSENVSPFKN